MLCQCIFVPSALYINIVLPLSFSHNYKNNIIILKYIIIKITFKNYIEYLC